MGPKTRTRSTTDSTRQTSEETHEESVAHQEEEEEEEEEEHYEDATANTVITEISQLSISQQTEMFQLWRTSQPSSSNQSPSNSSFNQASSSSPMFSPTPPPSHTTTPTFYKLPPMLKYTNDDDSRAWIAYAKSYIHQHQHAPRAELIDHLLIAVKESSFHLIVKNIVNKSTFIWSDLWTSLDKQIPITDQQKEIEFDNLSVYDYKDVPNFTQQFFKEIEFDNLSVYDYKDVPNFTQQFMSAITIYTNTDLKVKHKLFVAKIHSPTLRHHVRLYLNQLPNISIEELAAFTNRTAATLLQESKSTTRRFTQRRSHQSKPRHTESNNSRSQNSFQQKPKHPTSTNNVRLITSTPENMNLKDSFTDDEDSKNY